MGGSFFTVGATAKSVGVIFELLVDFDWGKEYSLIRIGWRRFPHVPEVLSNRPGIKVPHLRQALPSRFHWPSWYQLRSINSSPQPGHHVL
jgi:hypothetical protein